VHEFLFFSSVSSLPSTLLLALTFSVGDNVPEFLLPSCMLTGITALLFHLRGSCPQLLVSSCLHERFIPPSSVILRVVHSRKKIFDLRNAWKWATLEESNQVIDQAICSKICEENGFSKVGDSNKADSKDYKKLVKFDGEGSSMPTWRVWRLWFRISKPIQRSNS
jgi:hypothetical protein